MTTLKAHAMVTYWRPFLRGVLALVAFQVAPGLMYLRNNKSSEVKRLRFSTCHPNGHRAQGFVVMW